MEVGFKPSAFNVISSNMNNDVTWLLKERVRECVNRARNVEAKLAAAKIDVTFDFTILLVHPT